jgi:hypothetical protein
MDAIQNKRKKHAQNTLYKTDPEHYKKMHARLVESGAIDRVAKYGYYGTYGELEPVEHKMGSTNRRAASKLTGTATHFAQSEQLGCASEALTNTSERATRLV